VIVEPGICAQRVSFLVRDHGIALRPATAKRCFREFEQADERK